MPIAVSKEEQQNAFLPLQAEQDVDRVTKRNLVPKSDLTRHKLLLFYFVGLVPWMLQNRDIANMDSPLDF